MVTCNQWKAPTRDLKVAYNLCFHLWRKDCEADQRKLEEIRSLMEMEKAVPNQLYIHSKSAKKSTNYM